MSKWSRWNSVRKAWVGPRWLRRRRERLRQMIAEEFAAGIDTHLVSVADRAMLARRRILEELTR